MNTLSLQEMPCYTYDDYTQLQGRWELIHGIAYSMSPAPSITHQIIRQCMTVQLAHALENCPECQALLPVDWKIDEEIIVQPDNLVVCGKLAKDAYLTKTPILIFEILSPSTAK